jgi:hypothetical protein
MTKARDIADFKFENIVDTGTEGTKVASGTTAQRGSTTGQWRYNTTTNFFEGRNNTGSFQTLEPTPTVSSVDVSVVDSNAGGNQTIVISGTNFTTGAVASFVGSSASFNASTTTLNNSTQITAVAPKASFLNAQEPYKVKVTSTSGLAGTSASGLINVDTNPVWQTSAGALSGMTIADGNQSVTVSATDADGDTVTYSLLSGSLPNGTSLNTSTGVISGTVGSTAQTYSFTLRATANSVNADRAFTIATAETNYFGDGSDGALDTTP